MSSINRPLAGPELVFNLQSQLAELRQEEAYTRSGRAGRTLTKSGRLRLVLVALAGGHNVGTQQADSPMTVHVLSGNISFRSEGAVHHLRTGEVLYFGPGDAHDIQANEESAILITISAVGDDYLMDSPSEHEAPQHP